MKIIRQYFVLFLVFVLVMLVDGQLSGLMLHLFPKAIYTFSHVLLFFLLYSSLRLSKWNLISIFTILGFLYDSYYYHMLGITILIFLLFTFIVGRYNSILMMNRWTRFFSILIFVFLFEILTFLFAVALQLSSMNFGIFIVQTVAPTLLFNLIFYLLLQPVLEKLYL